MGEQLYKATFPVGSKVRIVPQPALDEFARTWKYHHKLQPEQMRYAGASAIVRDVSFYHGGDNYTSSRGSLASGMNHVLNLPSRRENVDGGYLGAEGSCHDFFRS
ncbi:MAG: hypothetical protein WA324_28895 [Bryobacteraceae bacterium]